MAVRAPSHHPTLCRLLINPLSIRERVTVLNRTTETAHATDDKLLDAAEIVFAERGYHAASTLEIARRAGVNKTLIHYYFRSKEGLYRALMERIARQLAPFLEDFSITDPVEALTAATRRYVRLLAESVAVLVPGGWWISEVGAGQAEEVASLARAAGLIDVGIHADLAGHGRVIDGRVAP